jgi:hypothetical protein
LSLVKQFDLAEVLSVESSHFVRLLISEVAIALKTRRSAKIIWLCVLFLVPEFATRTHSPAAPSDYRLMQLMLLQQGICLTISR